MNTNCAFNNAHMDWSACIINNVSCGDSVKAGPEGDGPPTREEEEEEREKMQANPAYLPIEMMSYRSQENQYLNMSSWSNGRSVSLYSVGTTV